MSCMNSEYICKNISCVSKVTSIVFVRMKSLTVLVCFLGLVVLCQSACFVKRLEITDIFHLPKGCVDGDGKEHLFGTKWTTKHCEACSCSMQGMSCCTKLPSQSEMSLPAHCQMVVNKATCSYKIACKK